MSSVQALKFISGGQEGGGRLRNHHLLIVGQTGSGKTTTALSLLDQWQHGNQTAIVLDPTGEYAQLPNAVTYRLGTNAYLAAGKLTAEELQEVLGLKLALPLQEKLAQAVSSLKVQQNILHRPGCYRKINQSIDDYQKLEGQLSGWASEYDITRLFDQLIEEMIVPFADQRANYTLLGQEYDRSSINHNWATLTMIRERMNTPAFRTLFDMDPHPGISKTELSFVLKMFLNHHSAHRTLVIDLSALKQFEQQQGAIISYLLKVILDQRLRHPLAFPVNIVLDEAHRYLPTDQTQLSHNGIFQLLREGRKVNLRMILTTQSPLDLPAKMRSQFQAILIHRLLSQDELVTLPTKLSFAKVANLPTGEAFLQEAGMVANRVVVSPPQWWDQKN